MDYLDDLMLLPSNGSASLRDPCWHGDLSTKCEHDVDGLLDMYERDEFSLDDPPVELPAPYSSVALSAFLCLDPQHATQPVKAGAHGGKPVRKACPAACARLTDRTTGRKPGHRSFPWGAVWVKAMLVKMRCAGASNTVIAAALTQRAGSSISYSIVSRRFPQEEAASQGQTK